MSGMEEARAIQHRCEGLEAACVRDSKLRPSCYPPATLQLPSSYRYLYLYLIS